MKQRVTAWDVAIHVIVAVGAVAAMALLYVLHGMNRS